MSPSYSEVLVLLLYLRQLCDCPRLSNWLDNIGCSISVWAGSIPDKWPAGLPWGNGDTIRTLSIGPNEACRLQSGRNLSSCQGSLDNAINSRVAMMTSFAFYYYYYYYLCVFPLCLPRHWTRSTWGWMLNLGGRISERSSLSQKRFVCIQCIYIYIYVRTYNMCNAEFLGGAEGDVLPSWKWFYPPGF